MRICRDCLRPEGGRHFRDCDELLMDEIAADMAGEDMHETEGVDD